MFTRVFKNKFPNCLQNLGSRVEKNSLLEIFHFIIPFSLGLNSSIPLLPFHKLGNFGLSERYFEFDAVSQWWI